MAQKEWVLDIRACTAGASGVPRKQGATPVNISLFGCRSLAETELFLTSQGAK